MEWTLVLGHELILRGLFKYGYEEFGVFSLIKTLTITITWHIEHDLEWKQIPSAQ